jgi:hypothetical protein
VLQTCHLDLGKQHSSCFICNDNKLNDLLVVSFASNHMIVETNEASFEANERYPRQLKLQLRQIKLQLRQLKLHLRQLSVIRGN